MELSHLRQLIEKAREQYQWQAGEYAYGWLDGLDYLEDKIEEALKDA